MCRKIICIILTVLMMLSVFGCAAPNVLDSSVKPGNDGSEATSSSDIFEYSGTITFYSESVDEAGKEPRDKRIRELEPEQAGQIADILSAVEWHNEFTLEMLALSFDGEIALKDIDEAVDFGGDLGREHISEKNNCICYFGYDKYLYLRFMPNDKSYYIGYYAPLTDEQMLYIKNMKP